MEVLDWIECQPLELVGGIAVATLIGMAIVFNGLAEIIRAIKR